MSVEIIGDRERCRLVFSGKLTFEFARELEDRIIAVLRRFSHVDVDLAAVEEIDMLGVHLLNLLRNMGGDAVTVVAQSPAVDQAAMREARLSASEPSLV